MPAGEIAARRRWIKGRRPVRLECSTGLGLRLWATGQNARSARRSSARSRSGTLACGRPAQLGPAYAISPILTGTVPDPGGEEATSSWFETNRVPRASWSPNHIVSTLFKFCPVISTSVEPVP